MDVVILRGIPGSGKSTYATSQERYASKRAFQKVSADDYFVGQDGIYRFDPKKLTEAHKDCWLAFAQALHNKIDIVVVDNTNISWVEVAAYVLPAQALGYHVEIMTIVCDIDLALSRQTHGVPEDKVRAMYVSLGASFATLPYHWQSIHRQMRAVK